MFDEGLIDEVVELERKYGREPKSMKSIGIKEVLDLIDGKTTPREAQELINIHTRQTLKLIPAGIYTSHGKIWG